MKKAVSIFVSVSAILTSLILMTGCGVEDNGINELQAKYAPTMINIKIEDEELARGWYYGDISEKKSGTPDEWLWMEDEEKPESSKWIQPPVEEMMDF